MNPTEFKSRFIPLLTGNGYELVAVQLAEVPVEVYLKRYADGSIRKGYAVQGGDRAIVPIPSWIRSERNLLDEKEAIDMLVRNLSGRIICYRSFDSKNHELGRSYLEAKQNKAIESLEGQLPN